MNGNIEAPLSLELLSGSEDNPFLIRSKTEIRFILREITRKGTSVVLYYGEGKDFILTMLIGANEGHVWLDLGSSAQENRQVLHSDKIIIVGSHRQAKVQFVAHSIETAPFGEREAFRLPLPSVLLRLQRRDYYRLLTPARSSLKCVMPAASPASARSGAPSKLEMQILDISGGGVALACAEHEADLQPGKIYQSCRIFLPGIGTLVATMRVKNVMEVIARDGAAIRHAGCEFLHLDGKMAMLLQRFIARHQVGGAPEVP